MVLGGQLVSRWMQVSGISYLKRSFCYGVVQHVNYTINLIALGQQASLNFVNIVLACKSS